MRFFMIVLFFGCYFIGQAQEIDVNGIIYKVKNESIFKDGIDVTETLSLDERDEIKSSLGTKIKIENEEKDRLAEIKKAHKNEEKAEKDQKRAEKRQKAAEKTLEHKEKAQSNFEKSGKKYQDAIQKYERLKGKGKLSPQEEGKWLKKIEKLKEATEKFKRKL